jgi:membrane-bound inhibitor of C-type lysozyme
MMKTITARYDGTCSATGARILPGDVIQWQKGKTVLLKRQGFRIDTIQFNDSKTYYRNARGRCEDAPCCGCCTI